MESGTDVAAFAEDDGSGRYWSQPLMTIQFEVVMCTALLAWRITRALEVDATAALNGKGITKSTHLAPTRTRVARHLYMFSLMIHGDENDEATVAALRGIRRDIMLSMRARFTNDRGIHVRSL